MTNYSEEELRVMSAKELREVIRKGEWIGPTIEACQGYAQTCLVILPKEYAFDWFLFCNRNPHPFPVHEVTDPGDPHPKLLATDADVRTDLPKYRVFKNGEIIDEPTDITKYWQDDLVSFFMGCSRTFVWALRAANISYRRCGAYVSRLTCVPAGRFRGHIRVGGRVFYSIHDAVRAIQISSRFPASHGTPIHIGTPADIGIDDLTKQDPLFPNYPPPEPPKRGEIIMFWAGGTTSHVVAMESKIPFMITHLRSHMFVTDKLAEELAVI